MFTSEKGPKRVFGKENSTHSEVDMSDQERIITKVQTAIDAIKRGEMVIMVDDEERENEGDLVLAADHVTPEKINFLAREARGLICLTMDPSLIERLRLPMMEDTSKTLPHHGTAFTVSIEARTGVTTGISAADRCRTIKVAISDRASPEDIVVPGHIFPLKSRHGGVLQRAGHTEGSVDLARLSGCKPAGVICEIMNDDGTMARMDDLARFSQKHQIPILTIADLITYRLSSESLVEKVINKPIKTSHGIFDATLFRNIVDNSHHLVLVNDTDFHNKIVDVRVHSQRQLIDVFGEQLSGGRHRIEYGLQLLAEKQHAALVYLTHPQTANSMQDEIRELFFENDGGKSKKRSPFQMDVRMHGTGAQILRQVGVQRMRVHTSSPRALKGLSGFGLEIVDNQVISENSR